VLGSSAAITLAQWLHVLPYCRLELSQRGPVNPEVTSHMPDYWLTGECGYVTIPRALNSLATTEAGAER
jgi:hypothetical protein